MKRSDKRAYLQISFALLFAIIVGGVILFLAVYTAIKLIGTEQATQDAKTGTEIRVLLNPLETGFETGKTSSLTMPVETRIYNKCNNEDYFGRQIIQVSQKSFSKWSETNIDVGFSNKYIFSGAYEEGKKFDIFSKPFEFPFKVADLIYVVSSDKEYCFEDAPDDIREELDDLGQENVFTENCSDESIKVCFADASCDINVDYRDNIVRKNKETIYFEGDALMYAAIFSDADLYECQLKRLLQRTEQLALLYRDKAEFVSRTGCESAINSELTQLSNLAENFEDSRELKTINLVAEDIKTKNDLANCRLW